MTRKHKHYFALVINTNSYKQSNNKAHNYTINYIKIIIRDVRNNKWNLYKMKINMSNLSNNNNSNKKKKNLIKII